MEKIVPHSVLEGFVRRVFLAMDCSEEDADTATTTLLSADLRGIDSHGIARLSGYVRLWEAGRVNARPDIRVVHETPSTAVVDGDAGLGLVVAPRAMRIAIAKAATAGTGWVAVRNSNHFGIAAHHAMQALEHGMVGLAMTNASALVAPTFSMERLLGTNPICVAVPAGEEPPFVADMATTTAANGKLEVHVVRTTHTLGEPHVAKLEQTTKCSEQASRAAREAVAAAAKSANKAIKEVAKASDDAARAADDVARVGDDIARLGDDVARSADDVARATARSSGLVAGAPTILVPAGIALDAGMRVVDGIETERRFEAGEISGRERTVAHGRNAAGMVRYLPYRVHKGRSAHSYLG